MDAGWYAEASEELDRIIHDFPKTDLSERAAGGEDLHHPGSRRPSAGPRSTCAAGPSNSTRWRRCSRLSRQAGFHRAPGRNPRRRASRRRAAGRRPGPGQSISASLGRNSTGRSGNLEEARFRGHEGHPAAPDAVRDRFLAWRKASAAVRPASRPVRPGDVGICRGQRRRGLRPGVADILWKARELVHDYLVSSEPTGRENCSPSSRLSTGLLTMARARGTRNLIWSRGSCSSCRLRLASPPTNRRRY